MVEDKFDDKKGKIPAQQRKPSMFIFDSLLEYNRRMGYIYIL